MWFDETHYRYFQYECIDRFGKETGGSIFISAENKLGGMIGEIAPGTSKVIRNHMVLDMLPTIAMYLAFRENEHTSDKAYDYTLELVQIEANKVKEKNRIIAKMPFAYGVFKLLCKSIVSRQYPRDGWDINWIRYDKREIRFDMTRCVYMETAEKYGCPEVCPIFCANDDTTFSGYKPKILFERAFTIGRGHDRCDFHFINGRGENAKSSLEGEA